MEIPESRSLEGFRGVAEAELLAALMLGQSHTRSVECANDLLRAFGGVGPLALASTEQLVEVGLSKRQAVRLLAGLELGRRALRPWRGRTVSTSEEAYRLVFPELANRPMEELVAIFLDRRKQVLGYETISRGSDAFTIVDARQVFRPAVSRGAAFVILAHNHPSGDPTPSAQDRSITRRLGQAGRVLGIDLCDHLVVGGLEYVSLASDCGPSGHAPEFLY